MNIRICLLLVLTCLLPFFAHAHTSSEAFLKIQLDGSRATGAWEFALQDLENIVGVDADGDGRISWGDIKNREAAIQQYILAGIALQQNDETCHVIPGTTMLNNRQDTVFLHVPVTVECPAMIERLQINYDLFFNQDIRHHAIWLITKQDKTFSRISSSDNRNIQVNLAAAESSDGFLEFVAQGVWHIWIGLDHILFLVLLMLGVENALGSLSPTQRNAQRWRRLIKTVTAFTIAHSVTLALATTAWFRLPLVWVESMIALSVIVAGLNVLFKWIDERLWLFAFGFGLIHGFGFASVLLDLELGQSSLLINLLAFNIGVESGQLVIVAGLVPLIIGLHRLGTRGLYIRHALSAGVIMLASVWLVQRSGM